MSLPVMSLHPLTKKAITEAITEAMQELFMQATVDDPPEFMFCSAWAARAIRNRLRYGDSYVHLTDTQAAELGISHLAQSRSHWDMTGTYDKRRVRRAMRRFRSRWHKMMPAHTYLGLPRCI